MGVKDRLKKLDDWSNQHRPMALLGIVALTIALVAIINYMSGSDLFRQFFFPTACDPKFLAKCYPLEWKELFQATVLILGLPVAFTVWHWRDVNKRAEIDNARKDTNLKEFQEVQLRAAGALDETLPAEAREQLQIAALHQLRGFLRGDYGESFKRPALELLLAGHAAAIHRIGVPQFLADPSLEKDLGSFEFQSMFRKRFNRVELARMAIIGYERDIIFSGTYNVSDRRFDFLNLSNTEFRKNLDFQYSCFCGSDLSQSRLDSANLAFVHFEGAFLKSTSLKNTRLDASAFDGAFMLRANICGALFRAIRRTAKTSFAGSEFNDATVFDTDTGADWRDLDTAAKNVARAPWIARGMINVDAKAADG